jgi:hypothetical protein
MEKEFIPYEQALALKELGYNEQDFGYYRLSLTEEQEPFTNTELMFFRERYDNHNFRLEQHPQIKIGGGICSAPLYQQAFRWFREKYEFEFHIGCYRHTSVKYYQVYLDDVLGKHSYSFGKSLTYEEAELECLKKLIEIVKEK